MKAFAAAFARNRNGYGGNVRVGGAISIGTIDGTSDVSLQVCANKLVAVLSTIHYSGFSIVRIVDVASEGATDQTRK
ncbi:hypothetical protein K0M31_014255 [Melipona bicolor]|uniref:Uncharacterized protein n=1 Tax=Melipona bicolor TaxID=60889 RepID=A0AA40KU53_9HYME|nr:hypothetical protein K0M31_014255 [Melipona bicolor]